MKILRLYDILKITHKVAPIIIATILIKQLNLVVFFAWIKYLICIYLIHIGLMIGSLVNIHMMPWITVGPCVVFLLFSWYVIESPGKFIFIIHILGQINFKTYWWIVILPIYHYLDYFTNCTMTRMKTYISSETV